MKKITCVLAILAAASTAAVAKDLKLKQMNNAEMDKVTAGRAFPSGGPNNQVDLPGQASSNAVGSGQGNSHSHGGRAADRF
jgi:hypothetical protein